MAPVSRASDSEVGVAAMSGMSVMEAGRMMRDYHARLQAVAAFMERNKAAALNRAIDLAEIAFGNAR